MGEDAELDEQASAVLTASRALLGVVARSLAPALEEVSLPQFRELVILSTANSPVRVGDLAEALGLHPSTLSRNADRLVAGGWVSRVENPDNRRETLLTLTAAGAKLVALVTRRRRTEILRVLQRMDPAERDQARVGFDVFAHAVGEPSAHDLAGLGM